MERTLLEYTDSRGLSLGVDCEAGVIRGVKILGIESRNGRIYASAALEQARELYEGAKVNVNHPKGNPLGPREYQDRIGVIRNVTLVAESGLFGDLHFNPRHLLAGQLEWDARHTPENVGLSHNVLARTTKRDERVVVEAITRVVSVDLVADPATTHGLFEELDPAATDLQEDLRGELANLREEVAELRAADARRQKQLLCARLMNEYGFHYDDVIVERLLPADEADIRSFLHELSHESPQRAVRFSGPRSREQHAVERHEPPAADAASFVRLITD